MADTQHSADGRRQFDRLSDILKVQLDNLHSDVKGMESVLQELTKAITKLAVMEERQANAHIAIERAFGILTKIEERVGALEKAVINTSRTSLWVDRALWATAAAALMYILRRDLNDVVRDVSGKVSAAKVSALVGQSIAAYLLLKHAQAVIERWDALAILLTILVAPDNFRKVINMKYSSGAKT